MLVHSYFHCLEMVSVKEIHSAVRAHGNHHAIRVANQRPAEEVADSTRVETSLFRGTVFRPSAKDGIPEPISIIRITVLTQDQPIRHHKPMPALAHGKSRSK